MARSTNRFKNLASMVFQGSTDTAKSKQRVTHRATPGQSGIALAGIS